MKPKASSEYAAGTEHRDANEPRGSVPARHHWRALRPGAVKGLPGFREGSRRTPKLSSERADHAGIAGVAYPLSPIAHIERAESPSAFRRPS